MKIIRMRVACWIPKATDTQSEFVIPLALPLQQWSYECYVTSTLAVVSMSKLSCI